MSLRLMLACLIIVSAAQVRAQPQTAASLTQQLQPATDAARLALEQPFDPSVIGPDIGTTLRHIAQQTGVPVRVNLAGLIGAGVDLSLPVPEQAKSGTLKHCLQQLGAGRVDDQTFLPVTAGDGAIVIDHNLLPPPRSFWHFPQGRWLVRGRLLDGKQQPVAHGVVQIYCWAHVVYATSDAQGEFEGVLPMNWAAGDSWLG